MSPSFTVKRGARYSFYVSSAILKGRKFDAGSVPRVSGADLDAAVLKALRHRIDVADDESAPTPRNIVDQNVSRIMVGSKAVTITLNSKADNIRPVIELLWSIPTRQERPRIEISSEATTPAPNPKLIQTIVRAHAWARLLMDGTHKTIESLARSAGVDPKVVRYSIRMAFLAPDITKAILEGDQITGIRFKDFTRTLPLSWAEQRQEMMPVASM
jgi:hypothetical protein